MCARARAGSISRHAPQAPFDRSRCPADIQSRPRSRPTPSAPVPAEGQVSVTFASGVKSVKVKSAPAGVTVAGGVKGGKLAVAVVHPRGVAASGKVALTVKGKAKGVKTIAAALDGGAGRRTARTSRGCSSKRLKGSADVKGLAGVLAAKLCGKAAPANAASILSALGLGAAPAPSAPPAGDAATPKPSIPAAGARARRPTATATPTPARRRQGVRQRRRRRRRRPDRPRGSGLRRRQRRVRDGRGRGLRGVPEQRLRHRHGRRPDRALRRAQLLRPVHQGARRHRSGHRVLPDPHRRRRRGRARRPAPTPSRRRRRRSTPRTSCSPRRAP